MICTTYTVDLLAKTFNGKRIEFVQQQLEKISDIENDLGLKTSENRDDLNGIIDTIENSLKISGLVDEKIEDCFTTDKTGEMQCNFCPGKYKREGHLRNHLESKHKKYFKLICKCGNLFPDFARLTRHKKTCN